MELPISIGKFQFCLVGLNDKLTNEIRRHYCGFISDRGEGVNINLNITIEDRKQNSVVVLEEVKFSDGFVHLETSDISGTFDMTRGEAHISVIPQHIEGGIDYVLRFMLALTAVQHRSLLLHAAGIIHDDYAYLFVGHSGVGKTTISRLSSGDTILSDDLVLIQDNWHEIEVEVKCPITERPNRWWVYGTPFASERDIQPKNTNAPLRAIFHLQQDKRVFISDMTQSQMVAELVANLPVINRNVSTAKMAMRLAENLTNTIQNRKLHFLPDASFWYIIGESYRN